MGSVSIHWPGHFSSCPNSTSFIGTVPSKAVFLARSFFRSRIRWRNNFFWSCFTGTRTLCVDGLPEIPPTQFRLRWHASRLEHCCLSRPNLKLAFILIRRLTDAHHCVSCESVPFPGGTVRSRRNSGASQSRGKGCSL